MATVRRLHNPCWFKRKAHTPSNFEPIESIRYIAAYRGRLKQSPYAIHNFIITKITGSEAIALNGTHRLICVCYLNRSPTQPRIVFDRTIKVQADSIARSLADDLYRAILAANRVFLVPCENKTEFPWCVNKNEFRQYWDIEFNIWYKFRSKPYNRK